MSGRLHLPYDMDDDEEPIERVPDIDVPDAVFQRIAERAEFEQLEDSGDWFATVPGYQGAWATGATQDAAREELAEVLRSWAAVGAHYGHPLPADIAHALRTST